MRIGFYAPCNAYNRRTGPLMGIAYIAAYLEEQLGLDDFFVEVTPERVLARKPDVIAISAFSEMYNQAISAARQFKQYGDIPIVIGGPHISALPQSLHPSMDIGVVGEGEIAMKRIVEILLRGEELSPQNLASISNLVYWSDEGKTEQAIAQERVQDLDDLPLPRRDIMHAFWPGTNEEAHWEQGIYTSRGCPFTCRFCMYSARPNLMRYCSVPRVLEDIADVIRKYPRQFNLMFYDDLFVTKKSRLKEIADGIRSEKLHQRVTFGCMAKTSFFDEEYCQILKSMNVRVISFGFESGSEPVLQFLKDRHSTVKKHQQALELCYKHGIHVGGYFIMGSPPETRQDLTRTYWFIRHNLHKMPLVSIFPILPLPGTQLWRDTEARGLIDPSFQNWENFGFLQLNSEHYIHLNENYPLEEMKDYYDLHFDPLMRRTTRVMVEENENLVVLNQYYSQLVASIREHFPPGAKLLEVQRGERQLQFALEDDYDLTSLHWTDLDNLDLQAGYDGVILTHTIEKFSLDSPQWRQLAGLNCPVLLVVENAACFARLLDLMRSTFTTDFEGLERYDHRYHYSLKSLQKALTQQGYRQLRVHRYRMQDIAGHSPHFQQMTQFLSQFIQIQSFLREADVFSYGLLLNKLALAPAPPERIHEAPLLTEAV